MQLVVLQLVWLQARGGGATRSAVACVVANLRRCDGTTTMAGLTDGLFCSDGAPGRRLRCSPAMAPGAIEIFVFFTWQLQQERKRE